MARVVKQQVWTVTGAFTGKPTSDQGKIFDVLRKAGARGMTKDDVMTALGFDAIRGASISSMLSGLKRMGAINFLGSKAGTTPTAKAMDIPALETEFFGLFERVLTAKANANDLPLDANESYQAYAKMKSAWLGRRTSSDDGTQNERAVAFRLAAIQTLKALI